MEEQEKSMEHELRTVIEGLAEGFKKDARMRHIEACAHYVTEYGERLLDPEKYSILVSFDRSELEEVLVDQLLSFDEIGQGSTYTREQRRDLAFLYTHYGYLKSHLKRIFETYEGSVCCVDKTRYVLGLYRRAIIDGNTPDFEDRGHYWVPNYGESGLYLALLRGLHQLYYGRPADYLDAHAELVDQLDQLVEAKRMRRHETYTTHACYTGHAEQPTRFGGRIKTVYSFKLDDTSLDIHIDEPDGNGFLLLVGDRQLGYRERDAYPDWTRLLMDEM